MAKKNTAEVLINGKIYTISGYESTAYLQKVAVWRIKSHRWKDTGGWDRKKSSF